MPVHEVDGALTAWNTAGEATSPAAAFANGQSSVDANGSVIMPPTASDR